MRGEINAAVRLKCLVLVNTRRNSWQETSLYSMIALPLLPISETIKTQLKSTIKYVFILCLYPLEVK